jgi:plasmid stabilization system protein ParE
MMKVIWSPKAEETFSQNIDYLEENWNIAVIENFLQKTEEALDIISKHPLTFPLVSKKKRIHKYLVVSQISLYYQVSKTQISLIIFWNNYQNPKKLRL